MASHTGSRKKSKIILDAVYDMAKILYQAGAMDTNRMRGFDYIGRTPIAEQRKPRIECTV
jgi:hypothetical protein